jgi:LuxR family transcriptional regulator, quorum-sensing system regulator SdiA
MSFDQNAAFSVDDTEDQLWKKMHDIAGQRYGVTSILYGFTHSKYTVSRVGITKSLYIKHSHPKEYIDYFGDESFLNNDICAAVLFEDKAPFIWHAAIDWEHATEAQKQQALIDRQFQMDVGVSFGFGFSNGQGIGGLGFCMRGMPSQEFEKIWADHSEEMVSLVSIFDGYMRTQMVKNRLALTPREKEVLAYAAGGMTAKEVAHHLGLQPKTIFNTLERARKSLKAGSTMEAVAKAYVYRLI